MKPNMLSAADRRPKIDTLKRKQGNYTLKSEQSPNLLGNDSKAREEILQSKRPEGEYTESVSEASKMPLETLSQSQ